jgi:hypothetical protein
MTAARRLSLVVAFGAALLSTSCRQKSTESFLEEIPRADKVVLYEGLPHPMFESRLLEKERQTKAVQELNGYPFYQEPLALTKEDAKHLSEILGNPATYQPFRGEKKCGGFHPDYAVEWQVSAGQYRALICFHCSEVKLFGLGFESRNELGASGTLQKLLKGYVKNRPAAKEQD